MIELGSSSCNQCGGAYTITRFQCGECAASIEGQFLLPRLARLDAEDRRFVEMFVLAGGSLKELGKVLGISYPTVRNRLDKVIATLKTAVRQDEGRRRSSATGGQNT